MKDARCEKAFQLYLLRPEGTAARPAIAAEGHRRFGCFRRRRGCSDFRLDLPCRGFSLGCLLDGLGLLVVPVAFVAVLALGFILPLGLVALGLRLFRLVLGLVLRLGLLFDLGLRLIKRSAWEKPLFFFCKEHTQSGRQCKWRKSKYGKKETVIAIFWNLCYTENGSDSYG